jgi:hypothetical protein
MPVSPCDLMAVATLATSVDFFRLHCTLEQVARMHESGLYIPELFSGEPCGIACATTDMETLGTGELSPADVLYSPEAAARTLDALVAYQHCRCRVKASVFNLACDCSLWEAIRDHRSSRKPPRAVFARLQSSLYESEQASIRVFTQATIIKKLAEHELETLCGSAARPPICDFSQSESEAGTPSTKISA